MDWLWCVRERSENWPLHFSFGNEEIYKTVGNKVEKENQELWGTCDILDGWWTSKRVIECLGL